MQSSLYGNIEVEGIELVLVGEENLFRRSRPGSDTRALAVLGDEAARKLGLSRGDVLDLGDRELTVDRVVASLPGGFDMAVFTELPVAQDVLDKPGQISAMRMGGC